jgi:hypothetical protein
MKSKEYNKDEGAERKGWKYRVELLKGRKGIKGGCMGWAGGPGGVNGRANLRKNEGQNKSKG